MCGLVALLAPAARVNAPVVETMRDRLAHRGPDGAGLDILHHGEYAIGLGHRRLAILDLSPAAAQPMRSGECAIVFNGEIYNYLELRGELEAAGEAFRTTGDTEVLLAAYRHWGTDCLAKLDGMFAFALWDAGQGVLFAARDRLGEKPLFWAPVTGGIAFASEMKALTAHPEVALDVDARTLAGFVDGSYFEDGDATLFAAIRRVPAATALLCRPGSGIERQWRYWEPVYHRASDPAEFRARLDASIGLRLRSDVPVGSSLSGGLDSSLVVGLLAERRRLGQAFSQRTFSARFDDDPSISEGADIDRMVAHAGVEASFVTPDPAALAAESRLLHWHQEEPFGSASIYLQFCVMRLARQAGVRVLLDGQGADELLGGYLYLFPYRQVDLLDQSRLGDAVDETVALTARLQEALAGLPEPARRVDASMVVPPRQLEALSAQRPPDATAAGWGVPPPGRLGRFRRKVADTLVHSSLPQLLRYADRNSMAFGVEARLPFLAPGFVDYCTGLPDDALMAGGWSKRVQRDAAAGLVPEAIRWRADKVGYAAPLDRWMRGPLAEWARDRLASTALDGIPGFDRALVEAAFHAHRAGQRDLSWPLWRWISLAEWLELGRQGAWRNGI